MKLGFLGTGHITSAIVTGLGSSDDRIWLSPRNAAIAADLARRFPNVSVASSNQDVLDRTDLVVLALPPRTAAETIAGLRFRADHHVVSVISSFPLKSLAAVVAPATDITRAVPLPSVAERIGPTAICPPHTIVAALFDRLGTAIPVEREDEFEAFCAVTAAIASYLAFAETVASWLARHGIPEAAARTYTTAMFRGAVNAEAHATPGGINEQLLQDLTQHGLLEHLSAGLDAVLRRITC
jgi:pyrroline-5-carboxylate reductase